MANDTYYYGQGRVYLAKRDTSGNPINERFIGDVSALSVKLEVDKVEHKESFSGQKALVRSFPIGKTATLDMTMHQVDTDNLALALYGTSKSVTGSTVTDESLPENLAAGDSAALAHGGVSAVTVTDSTGTPASLTEGTDYTVDATFGRITIVDPGSYTQPFKVSYTYADAKSVGMFTSGQPELFLRYEGYNLAEGNSGVIVALYKVAPDPLQELALISDGNDVAGMQVSAGLLLDTSKSPTADLGQFGSISYPGAPA